MKCNSLISIFLLQIYQGGFKTSNNRCCSLCCCLYSTSSFRLWRIEQRADSTYWIHKNNKPIKDCGMNKSITGPEETISLILWHIWKTTNETAKMSLCFFSARDWSLRYCFVGILNLEVHTAGNILCSHRIVIYSQGSREAIQSNSLQLKLKRQIWVLYLKQMVPALTKWTFLKQIILLL